MKTERTERFRDRRAGGVNLEYVILAVLVAAAVVVAVVVFSRSVAGMFIVAGEGATLREETARQTLGEQRARRDADAAVAKEYHDAMHE